MFKLFLHSKWHVYSSDVFWTQTDYLMFGNNHNIDQVTSMAISNSLDMIGLMEISLKSSTETVRLRLSHFGIGTV